MRTPVANIGNNHGAFQLYGNNKHAVRRNQFAWGKRGGGGKEGMHLDIFVYPIR